MKQNRKLITYPILLTLFTALLLYLTVPKGMLFASGGDWYSQHVSVAEHFRQMFYETGSLFFQFSSLGGGSNVYDFAYYGYLRPDILFSYLVPGLEMKYIITGYAVLGIFASVNLCFFWLKKQNISPVFCAAGSILLVCATCFFQAHRQIMFINYMPFLLLMLIGIDRLLERGKQALLISALFLIYMHSFYFSISCLFVCLLYFLYKSERPRPLKSLILSVGISIGMACILLLPVGLDILSNKKDAGSFLGMSEIFSCNLSLDFFLYDTYGCGLTLLALYCLLLSILRKQTRALSLILFFSVFLHIVSYVLNGTLYVRPKALMPLVPLFILLCAMTLEELAKGIRKPLLLPALLCFLPAYFSRWRDLILVDGAILAVIILVLKLAKHKKAADKKWAAVLTACCCTILLTVPALVSIGVGRYEEYLPADDKRQSLLSDEELAEICTDSRYRFDCLTEKLINSNRIFNGSVGRTSMYSSTTNSQYADFYYNIIKNPISIRNRVALLPDVNSFFTYFMGVRYLQTYETRIPYGYETAYQNGEVIIAENKNVLPIAYGTTELLAETAFDQLSFPDHLEALTAMTVVNPVNTGAKSSGGSRNTDADSAQDTLRLDTEFTSHMKEANPLALLDSYKDLPKEILKECRTAQGGTVKLAEEKKITLSLAEPLLDQLLLVSFQVESPKGREVSITINGTRNKLSDVNAAYPNHNNSFTYVVSSNKELSSLKLTMSAGTYVIKDLSVHTLDAAYLKHESITEFQFSEPRQDMVLNGLLDMDEDGYFVTSIPYRKGFQALIDGRETAVETVNKAFVGFPLSAGSHEIVLLYHAPGRSAGMMISVVSLIGFIVVIIKERRKVK